MSIRRFIQSKPEIPDDLANSLGQKGVSVILGLIRDAYLDLNETGAVSADMDENQITEEWFVHLQMHWKQTSLSLVPIHEKQDDTKRRSRKGKSPTIDCCFRDRWHRQSYFGIECKIVEANNKKLCDEYVTNGVQRFVDCRYSANCSEGAILGYVRQTASGDLANEISSRMAAADKSSQFMQTTQLLPFEAHYTSKHRRVECLSPFILHHFLLSFTV